MLKHRVVLFSSSIIARPSIAKKKLVKEVFIDPFREGGRGVKVIFDLSNVFNFFKEVSQSFNNIVVKIYGVLG